MSGVPRSMRDSTSAGDVNTAASIQPAEVRDAAALPRTRAGTAWVLACVAAFALLVLIVFITQNTRTTEVSFLGWHGDFPLAVALLAATLIGAVLALILGTTRIVQLRRTALRSRRKRSQAERPTINDGPERSAL
jgi:uncharacterized integral membrane protein